MYCCVLQCCCCIREHFKFSDFWGTTGTYPLPRPVLGLADLALSAICLSTRVPTVGTSVNHHWAAGACLAQKCTCSWVVHIVSCANVILFIPDLAPSNTVIPPPAILTALKRLTTMPGILFVFRLYISFTASQRQLVNLKSPPVRGVLIYHVRTSD